LARRLTLGAPADRSLRAFRLEVAEGPAGAEYRSI
jgi:hypothetical protein